ncbi:methylated-DNA--protein-cysteine methyltransferase isoform X1 [Caloenas nicobarica]|uniref:methylated-DNA--protein-cysteine methyltransferase isoform X1 n=1 Tax=Caloenas nicobarica TaxID=187106 RepID=UPI0032B70B01
MASRLLPKVASEEGGSRCKESRAVLLSPVGRLEISGCETGLHEIKLPRTSVLPSGGAESWAACELCEGAEEPPEPLRQCAAWLRAYFCQPERTPSLPLPPFHHPLLRRDSFTRQVLWTLLRDVKFGEAISYKQLADLAGNSKAARAVGAAMRSNPGDPQQRAERQLRRRTPPQGVAFVAREAPEREAGTVMQLSLPAKA